MSSSYKESSSDTVIRKVTRRQEIQVYGGAWKVAFADFVLALMCLFLVLWVLAVRDQENLERILHNGGSRVWEGTESRIDHQSNPFGSLIPREPIPGQQERGVPANAKSRAKPAWISENGQVRYRYNSTADMEKLANMLSELSVEVGLAGNIQTVITPYGLRVMLHDTDRQGMFERGSEVINERFKRLLIKMGEMFVSIDNQLLVVGHTDSLQYKEQNYAAFSNWSLSSNRAMAARVYLLKGGMPNQSILQVVGMADRAPLDQAHPAAAINRRIELLILTTGQAKAVSNMFGMPSQTQTISPDVKAAFPDAKTISSLKEQLSPKR